jgi:TatD DNase family protein
MRRRVRVLVVLSYVPGARDEDLDLLDQTLADHLHDPRLLAVGEIGLDFFVPEFTVSPLREKQERFYRAQLRLARKYQLPVILHVRRALDQVLKGLRQLPVRSGIAHAFNGSEQQALAFQSLGFCLGFGGAMTSSRALQIRRLAAALDGTAIVLETDAPDIAPEWLHGNSRLSDPERRLGVHARNSPEQLPRIAACLAQLREQSYEHVCAATSANVMRVLPRFQALFTGPAH